MFQVIRPLAPNLFQLTGYRLWVEPTHSTGHLQEWLPCRVQHCHGWGWPATCNSPTPRSASGVEETVETQETRVWSVFLRCKGCAFGAFSPFFWRVFLGIFSSGQYIHRKESVLLDVLPIRGLNRFIQTPGVWVVWLVPSSEWMPSSAPVDGLTTRWSSS